MNSSSSSKSRPLLWVALAALPLAALTSESLAWWWKHPPEPEEGRDVLSYSFPVDREGATPSEVKEGVRKALSFDEAQSGSIEGTDGQRLNVNYFEWNNTEASGLADAFGHAPDECMGNLGNEVQAFLPDRNVSVDGRELVFDTTQFADQNNHPLFIFKLSWAEGMEGMNLLRDGPRGEAGRTFKVKSVANRWFPQYARVLMVSVSGERNDEEAWKAVEELVLDDLSFRKVKK